METKSKKSQQLTLNFDASEFDGFATCREYMQHRVPQLCFEQKKLQKAVAADMDMAPSCLTRKLVGAENDKRRLTVDDLENYLATQRDMKPLLYLVHKFLIDEDDVDALRKEIDALNKRLAAKQARRA